jgi:hypothetical protein
MGNNMVHDWSTLEQMLNKIPGIPAAPMGKQGAWRVIPVTGIATTGRTATVGHRMTNSTVVGEMRGMVADSRALGSATGMTSGVADSHPTPPITGNGGGANAMTAHTIEAIGWQGRGSSGSALPHRSTAGRSSALLLHPPNQMTCLRQSAADKRK